MSDILDFVAEGQNFESKQNRWRTASTVFGMLSVLLVTIYQCIMLLVFFRYGKPIEDDEMALFLNRLVKEQADLNQPEV